METERKNHQELMHLGFIRIATMHALVLASSLYEFAKQNSGPLRSMVGTVEGAVTTVVGPVYEKFKGVPSDLLVFFDKKVDEATVKFEELAPPLAKKVVSQAQCMIQAASEKAHTLVNEAQVGGPRRAFHYATEESKQMFLTQVVRLWLALDQILPFHTLAELAVPTAAHWSEKYNQIVEDMTHKGCSIFGYIPLVPVDEVSKAFKQGKARKEEDMAAVLEKDSDSD